MEKVLSKNSQSFGRSFRVRPGVGPRSKRSLATLATNGEWETEGTWERGRVPSPRPRPGHAKLLLPRGLSCVRRALCKEQGPELLPQGVLTSH